MEQRAMIGYHPPAGPRRLGEGSAFTLVELLAVMAIVIILLTIVAPLTTSIQESSNLAFGGSIVGDQLILARQIAASRNLTVEVRFIAANTPFTGYNDVQLWQTSPATGTAVALDRMVTLPTGIEVSSNGTLSPLVSSGNGGLAAAPAAMPASAGTTAGKSYVSFTIRPIGVVEVGNPPAGNSLARAPSYFLTVLPSRYDASSTLPKNYLTLQVNPDTAYTEVFQP